MRNQRDKGLEVLALEVMVRNVAIEQSKAEILFMKENLLGFRGFRM